MNFGRDFDIKVNFITKNTVDFDCRRYDESHFKNRQWKTEFQATYTYSEDKTEHMVGYQGTPAIHGNDKQHEIEETLHEISKLFLKLNGQLDEAPNTQDK